jgi:hypothetical protein
MRGYGKGEEAYLITYEYTVAVVVEDNVLPLRDHG